MRDKDNKLEDMGSRIGYTRVVQWTETFERSVAICFRKCGGCGVETPDPTREMVLKSAQNATNRNRHFMWPSDDIDDGVMPEGWKSKGSDLYCPECLKAVDAALASRKKR